MAAEIESQLISAVEVLPGHAGDQQKALEMVEQSERVMEAKVEETLGDCAYGGGPRRRALAEAERPLTAKVPASHNGDCFPKSELAIDLERMEARSRRGRRRTIITPPEKAAGGTSLLRRPMVRPAPYDRAA